MKTFVIGDIHGAHKALKQCLDRADFDYEKDELICLGDLCDGWPETAEVLDELKKVKNLILIVGNHDVWFMEWFKTGTTPIIWTEQGGKATLDSYMRQPDKIIEHRDFFKDANYLMIDEQNRLFVHGGILKYKDITKTPREVLCWDRTLYQRAMSSKSFKGDLRYKEIFIGHTSTEAYSLEPVHRGNVWMLDQGAGWNGKLTIMDVNSKEYWQSDLVTDLYPDSLGRGVKKKWPKKRTNN